MFNELYPQTQGSLSIPGSPAREETHRDPLLTSGETGHLTGIAGGDKPRSPSPEATLTDIGEERATGRVSQRTRHSRPSQLEAVR